MMRMAASEGFDYDSISEDKQNEYISRVMQALGHLRVEEEGRRLAARASPTARERKPSGERHWRQSQE
jgi:hypothetical protein